MQKVHISMIIAAIFNEKQVICSLKYEKIGFFGENIGISKENGIAKEEDAVKINENGAILHKFFKKIFEIFLA